MTELCDYFKVWFSEVASLHDPIDGSVVTPQTTESQTNTIIEEFYLRQFLLDSNVKSLIVWNLQNLYLFGISGIQSNSSRWKISKVITIKEFRE